MTNPCPQPRPPGLCGRPRIVVQRALQVAQVAQQDICVHNHKYAGARCRRRGRVGLALVGMPQSSVPASTCQGRVSRAPSIPARPQAKRNEQQLPQRTSCFAAHGGHIIVHGLILHGPVGKIGHRCRQLQQAVKCEGVWGRW